PIERGGRVALGKRQGRGSWGDADETHALDVAAVRVARLQSDLLELIGQIRDRAIFAFRTRAAPLALIGRHDLRMREDLSRVDLRQVATRGASDDGSRTGCRGAFLTVALLRAANGNDQRQRERDSRTGIAHACILPSLMYPHLPMTSSRAYNIAII